MDLTTPFDTSHGSYCIILAKFYIYLQYFQQKKNFNFSKISEFQIDPYYKNSLILIKISEFL